MVFLVSINFTHLSEKKKLEIFLPYAPFIHNDKNVSPLLNNKINKGSISLEPDFWWNPNLDVDRLYFP